MRQGHRLGMRDQTFLESLRIKRFHTRPQLLALGANIPDIATLTSARSRTTDANTRPITHSNILSKVASVASLVYHIVIAARVIVVDKRGLRLAQSTQCW